MRLAAGGDDNAYAGVARRIQDDLFRMALSQGMRSHDAFDVAQETLLRACERLDVWREGNNTRCWFLGIAMNVIRENRRKRAKHFAMDVTTLGIAAGGGADLEADEMLERLASAMQALPSREREAVACRYLSQLSVRETAAVMGCAEGTVRAALRRSSSWS